MGAIRIIRLVSNGYEARGNMTSLGAVTMGYDAESNLTSVHDTGIGQNDTTWIYDAEGQRAQSWVTPNMFASSHSSTAGASPHGCSRLARSLFSGVQCKVKA
jgi:YD repeat-containing protein